MGDEYLWGLLSHEKGERNRSDHLRERKEIYGNKIITATEVEEEKKSRKMSKSQMKMSPVGFPASCRL